MAWVFRLVLAGVFVAAAVSKLLDPASFVTAVRSYALVPGPLVLAVAYALPRLELGLALALGLGLLPRVTPRVTQALLAVFVAAIGYRLLSGEPTPCGCFGGSEFLTWRTLVRDFGLISIAQGLVVLEARGLFARRGQEYAALAGVAILSIVAGTVLPLWGVPSYGVAAVGPALRSEVAEGNQDGSWWANPVALRVVNDVGAPVELEFLPGEMWLVLFADARCSLCGDIGRWLDRNLNRLSGAFRTAVVVGGVVTEAGPRQPRGDTLVGSPVPLGLPSMSGEAVVAFPPLTLDQARLAAESWGLNSSMYFDPGDCEAARHGLTGTPAVLLIIDGKIRAAALAAKVTPARHPDLMDVLGDSAGAILPSSPCTETPTVDSWPVRPPKEE